MNFINCLLVLSFSIIVSGIQTRIEPKISTDEIRELRKELFVGRHYDKYARPVPAQDQLRVHLKLSLIHVRELDLKSQTLTTDGWLFYQWYDEGLKWEGNPKYSNIITIRVPSDEIFTPDIMVYNGVDFTTKKLVNTNVVLSINGLVIWVPPITTKALCQVDLSKWPYDEHICFLKFGSWTYHGLIMDVKAINETKSITSDLFVSPEFDIEFVNVTNADKQYECCAEPYPSVTFYFKLQRKPNLYHYMICVPTLVAIILSLTTFWFPIRSAIRFVLNGMSLLTLTLILLHLSTELGFSSLQTPTAVRFMSLTTLFIGIIQIWFTIAFNISMVKSDMPPWTARLTKPMAHLTKRESTDVKENSGALTAEELVIWIDKIILAAFISGMAIVFFV